MAPAKKRSRPQMPTRGSAAHLQHLALVAKYNNDAAAYKADEARHYAEAARRFYEATRDPGAASEHLAHAERHLAEAKLSFERADSANNLKLSSLPADLQARGLPSHTIARSTIHNCIQIHIGRYSSGTPLKKCYENNETEQAVRDCASCSGMNYADVENAPPKTIGEFEEAVIKWYRDHNWNVV